MEGGAGLFRCGLLERGVGVRFTSRPGCLVWLGQEAHAVCE